MAPGAFERAHPSPRANADPGPPGGTAPDSPRAFLAAMEDGVYGKSVRGGAGSMQMEPFVPNVPPRTFLLARARLTELFGPRRRCLAFVGLGMGFRRGPRAGRSRPLFGPILFPVAAGGAGWGGGVEEAGRNHSPWRGRTSPVPAGSREGGVLGAAG